MAEHIFPHIYQLIKEDKIKESLEFLMKEIPDRSNDWVLFINRIVDVEKKNDLGTLRFEEYKQEKAKIIYGLTHILNEETSKDEQETPAEANSSGELVTGLVRDQISFLGSRIRELNLFKIGLGVFTSIVFFISAYYMYDNMVFFKEINLHLFSIILFVLYLLIILVSLFLIHLTKENLSDNKVKFSIYRQVFRKIKI